MGVVLFSVDTTPTCTRAYAHLSRAHLPRDDCTCGSRASRLRIDSCCAFLKTLSCVNACYYLILNIIYEICAIILSAKNFKMMERGLHEVPFPCSFSLWCTCSRDQTTSTGTVISIFVYTVHALDSSRTSSRNMCCWVRYCTSSRV